MNGLMHTMLILLFILCYTILFAKEIKEQPEYFELFYTQKSFPFSVELDYFTEDCKDTLEDIYHVYDYSMYMPQIKLFTESKYNNFCFTGIFFDSIHQSSLGKYLPRPDTIIEEEKCFYVSKFRPLVKFGNNDYTICIIYKFEWKSDYIYIYSYSNIDYNITDSLLIKLRRGECDTYDETYKNIIYKDSVIVYIDKYKCFPEEEQLLNQDTFSYKIHNGRFIQKIKDK